MTRKTISIDAMGGDHGPAVVVPAALKVLRAHPDLDIIFVGRAEILEPLLQKKGAGLASQWRIQPASEIVAMDESPASALRGKKDSSMRVAINLVKQEQAHACVSAGNTGALMATARFVLKTLRGIDRPAIVTRFPTRVLGKEVYVLDLGANVDCTAENLYQFAVMGSILAASVNGETRPRVGLLNVGQEEIKGNEQVKRSAELLAQNASINYTGYVEGDQIFSGDFDVVVCDGFVGNVTLKAIEGASKLIAKFIRDGFSKNIFTKLIALIAMPILMKVQERMDPRRHNGAILIGLKGIVIKSHGSAGVMAFAVAIEQALIQIEKNIPHRISERVGDMLEERGPDELQ